MMSLWDALRMNMMISYQELVRTFPKSKNIGCDPPAGATLTELINDLLNTAVGIGIVGLIDV